MATNLTGQQVNTTYDQLLHINEGPTASEKDVVSGIGVVTALKLGTGSASVDNIRIDGNTISSTNTNGDITMSPDGTGAINIANTLTQGIHGLRLLIDSSVQIPIFKRLFGTAHGAICLF